MNVANGSARPSRSAMRNQLVISMAIAMALASCADSRPLAPPPAIGVSLHITVNKWAWIRADDRRQHDSGGDDRTQGSAPLADRASATGDGGGAGHHPSDGSGSVKVEIGYGEMVYDSLPIDRFAEKATIQAGFGVRNWIRIREGERVIEVGSIDGRKGAGIFIELGPGISTSEY